METFYCISCICSYFDVSEMGNLSKEPSKLCKDLQNFTFMVKILVSCVQNLQH